MTMNNESIYVSLKGNDPDSPVVKISIREVLEIMQEFEVDEDEAIELVVEGRLDE
jgi:hypothetical protein